MLIEEKLSVKDEPKILPRIFGIKNKASKMTEIEWRWVKNSMQSREMKYLSFPMFNNKSKLFEK